MECADICERRAEGRFSPLSTTWIGLKKVHRLDRDLVYRHPVGNIWVPAGFETDLDSVPRLPFIYFLLKGRSRRPPVLHDWMYAQQMGRRIADVFFLEAMRDVGVPVVWRLLIYWGVRFFGFFAYRRHGKK